MMDCEQFAALVSGLLDGELDAATTAAARTHAHTCAGCGAVLASSQQMLGWLGDDQNFALPPAASVRLRQRLERGLEHRLGQEMDLPVTPPAPSASPRKGRNWGWNWGRNWGRNWGWLRHGWAAALVLIVLVAGLARWRASATTLSGWLIDQDCAVNFRTHPGDHSLTCLRHCIAKGVRVGLLDAHGRFRPFDAHGEQSALAAIANTQRTKQLWITITARPAGHGVLDVEQLALTEPPTPSP